MTERVALFPALFRNCRDGSGLWILVSREAIRCVIDQSIFSLLDPCNRSSLMLRYFSASFIFSLLP